MSETPEVVTVAENNPPPNTTPPTSPRRRRPGDTIVSVARTDPPYPGDVLIVLAIDPRTGNPSRLSVRPLEKCGTCRGRGWNLARADDGTRAGLMVPAFCSCIAKAVERVCGPTAKLASWETGADDPRMVAWMADLLAQTTTAEANLATVLAERERQAYEAEAEAMRLDEQAEQQAPVACEASRQLAAAIVAHGAAWMEIVAAQDALAKAEAVLLCAREALTAATAAHAAAALKVDPARAAAMRLRATVEIIRRAGPKSASGVRERGARAQLAKLKLETERAAAVAGGSSTMA